LNRSRTLDLNVLLDMVRDADVLVCNIRPAAMSRLRLEWEKLGSVNPRLIYVGTFGYSQRGRCAAEPAFDDLIQAASGLVYAMGKADGGPPPMCRLPWSTGPLELSL
jgi:crotonobetainyl-CoA:carnitine CoA-transferase CaiB-like acyl-CoA transferase|tara:strand:+ start:697 stop:1017 length:321 start_codon:yes stop_codon:yes gene_type:complete